MALENALTNAQCALCVVDAPPIPFAESVCTPS